MTTMITDQWCIPPAAEAAAVLAQSGEVDRLAGVFTALGADWRHYAGGAEDRTVKPFDAGHPPVIGWRPAECRAIITAR
jgi:hypothetical protein